MKQCPSIGEWWTMAKKKKKTVIRPTDVTGYMIRLLVSCYVLALFVALPVLYHNRYYDIGVFKFDMYVKMTVTLVVTVGLTGILHFIFFCVRESREGRLKDYFRQLPGRFSVIDWFALAYAAAVLLCYAASAYKSEALYGYEGWSMGLLSQLSFVLLYFLVSRFWNRNWFYDFLWVMCIASAIAFFFAVLHRFLIDPLALYEGIDETYHIQFLSTIGQATWYSSFLCTVFPIGLLCFWFFDKRWQRVCSGIYCILGYATLVTQNSDSAFVSLGAMWFAMFCLSFDSNKAFKRFLEVVILGLATMRVIGLLQLIFADRAVQLDEISVFASQHYSLWGILVLCIAVYYLIDWADKRKGFQIGALRWMRPVLSGLLVLSVVVVVLLIVLTTQHRLPKALSALYSMPFLIFDSHWGNWRGTTWPVSARMFLEYPLKEKLIGIGPDCYSSYVYEHYREAVEATFADNVLTNAHNEWLNILLNEGVLGLVTYLGFFLSAAVTFIRNRSRNLLTFAVIICIFSYIFHNVFCYQQIMCTPFIFILIGLGAFYGREE